MGLDDFPVAVCIELQCEKGIDIDLSPNFTRPPMQRGIENSRVRINPMSYFCSRPKLIRRSVFLGNPPFLYLRGYGLVCYVLKVTSTLSTRRRAIDKAKSARASRPPIKHAKRLESGAQTSPPGRSENPGLLRLCRP